MYVFTNVIYHSTAGLTYGNVFAFEICFDLVDRSLGLLIHRYCAAMPTGFPCVCMINSHTDVYSNESKVLKII